MTQLDPEFCYRAVLARDSRFDGRFFVAVSSTRVYCRPICRVRTPKSENCRYYASAAAAEQQGYRPCLRCRPELAPGLAAVDASNRLAQAAARLIESGQFERGGIEAVARRVGTTDRHLRRIFGAQFGVSPVEYAQTRRMLLAKQLLTDTAMTVIDVAAASGFASLRRFNASFRERYRLTPTQLRTHAKAQPLDRLRFRLAYRRPYDWDHVLGFLRTRLIDGVEAIDGRVYRRTVGVLDVAPEPAGLAPVGTAKPSWARGASASIVASTHAPVGVSSPSGWISVEPLAADSPGDVGLVQVEISASLAPRVSECLQRVRWLFDLDGSPYEVAQVLGDLARGNEGVRLPGAFDGFELAVRAILGQQITVKAARTLAGRFAARFGEPVATPFEGVHHLFPPAAVIAGVDYSSIAELGIIANRSRSIIALAAALASGGLRLDPTQPVDATVQALKALPGIGDWTAQYIAMRALAWPDAFPAGDLVVRRALGVERAADASAAASGWQPWRAYAVMHLWKGATP